MNAKRQTIWLVSMLSLMVVMSAYYLFTEEASSPAQETVDYVRIGQTFKEDAMKSSEMPDIKVTEVSTEHGTEHGEKADDKDKQDATMTQVEQDKDLAAKTEDNTQQSKEQAVLDKVEAEGVMKRSSIEEMQIKRSEKVQREMERLLSEINSSSGEKTAAAYEEMTRLEDQESKIANLETELQKHYNNAVIKHENDKYQVLVQRDKMNAKEAVEIVGKIMKDLNVTQDKVSVAYVTE